VCVCVSIENGNVKIVQLQIPLEPKRAISSVYYITLSLSVTIGFMEEQIKWYVRMRQKNKIIP